jgi:L-rhamnonate dehydratase
MKITDVRLFRVDGEGPAWSFESRSVEPLDRYPDHRQATAGAGDVGSAITARYVEIVTDEGAEGRYGPIDARQAFLIASDLRQHLIGEDALAIEAIHDRLLRVQRHGRAGIFVNAISAVDNTLWDLRGRAFDVPVYRLLGGPTRARVPAYGSMLGFSVDPDEAAAIAAEHKAQGFDAQKWFFAHGPSDGADGLRRNVEMARSVRSAVGEGYPLMFDAFMGWDLTYAGDMLRALEPLDPWWVEEPVPPERVSLFRRLATMSTIRLATGEHVHTRWQVRELLDAGVGVIQADPDWAGGLSEQVRICALCSAHGHAMSVPVHVAASQSPQVVPMVEYLVRIQERNQWFHRVPLVPVRGAIELPSAPGFGIELDPDKVLSRVDLPAEGGAW